MKKIIAFVTMFFPVIVVNAQDDPRRIYIDDETFQICATIFVLLAFMLFILAILKRILDYRLKNKIVDKGIPESIVSSILQTNPGENKHASIKWFAILAGGGIGLTIIYCTLPLGIHSLAIMAFSIALSFLGYFFYQKQSGQ